MRVVALALIFAAPACSGSDDNAAPGAASPDEERALSQAAEMLDERPAASDGARPAEAGDSE